MKEQQRISRFVELKNYNAAHQDYCSATDYAIAKASQWGYEQRGAH